MIRRAYWVDNQTSDSRQVFIAVAICCFGQAVPLFFWHQRRTKGRPELASERSSRQGVFLGLLLVVLGVFVAYLGIIGEFTVISELSGIYAEEVDAAAGAVLVIIGLVVIWRARAKA
jgi:cytochrome c biogenesis protein CcdA